MSEQVRVDVLLREAASTLAEASVPSAAVDARVLLAHVLGVTVSEVVRLGVMRERADAQQAERFGELVDERARRVPLQHLTGRAPFRHIELEVGPGVFVPRPETELLAGWAVERAEQVDHERPLVVDLCTGSGAVALSVATECPQARVVAVELSPEALAWVERNRDTIAPGVELREGDATLAQVTDDLDGDAHVVVSNPPYVPPDAVPKDPEVAEHDPAIALYGLGNDGLRVPLGVAERAAHLLTPGGWFGMEHADVQSSALVSALVADPRWTDVSDNLDYAGRPRYVTARRV